MAKQTASTTTTKAAKKQTGGSTKKLSAYNVFMQKEIKALKAAGETDHKAAFKQAAAKWTAQKSK